MRHLIIFFVSTWIAALAVTGTASTAHAAAEFDLYALKSPGLHVNSGGCRHVTVTARTNAPSWVEDVDAEVDLWKGGRHIDTVSLDEVNYDPQRLSGSFFYCPGLDPVGAYRLGDTEVQYWDYDYNGGLFIDGSRGAMTIKQAVRTRTFSARRDGVRRVFRAHAQYFDTGVNAWHNFPKGTKVHMQRRAANGTGSWLRIATSAVQRRGRVAFALRAKRMFQYRLVAAGTPRSWNLVSPVRKI